MLGTARTPPNPAQQAVLLADLEITPAALPPEFLARDQGAQDGRNDGQDSEDGVVPREAVEGQEEGGDAARGGFVGDLGRVGSDFVDGFEDRGA